MFDGPWVINTLPETSSNGLSTTVSVGSTPALSNVTSTRASHRSSSQSKLDDDDDTFPSGQAKSTSQASLELKYDFKSPFEHCYQSLGEGVVILANICDGWYEFDPEDVTFHSAPFSQKKTTNSEELRRKELS
jgi:hypothetical protein